MNAEETLAFEIVAHITKLAIQISQSGKAHCFVSYFGHVRELDVHVLPADTVYDGIAPQERLFEASVYIRPDESGAYDSAVRELERIIHYLLQLAYGSGDEQVEIKEVKSWKTKSKK